MGGRSSLMPSRFAPSWQEGFSYRTEKETLERNF